MNSSLVLLRSSRRVLALGLGLLAIGAGAAAPVRILPLGSPRLWHKLELSLVHAPVAANNFDPEQIALDVTFTAPSGRRLKVPAFWFQDYRRELVGQDEKLSAVGEPGWRVRFTPTEAGRYAMQLTGALGGAAPQALVEGTFEVPSDPAATGGWVRLGSDRRYFETSDGRPLRVIGQNLCWGDVHGTVDYDTWFAAMRTSGQNLARLWMAPWWAALEQTPESLTRYHLDGAWQLDHVFSEAEKQGIYLLLCFDFHGMFQSDNPAWGGTGNHWPKHPYNVVNGGPCRQPNDFFTDATAGRLYQKRLRYLIARYGASPHLLAWQFFNEIDNVFEPRGLRGADVIRWHQEMTGWLKAHDAFGHLVTTSLTGGSDRPEVWRVPEMDFAVYHSYDEAAPARRHAQLSRDFFQRYQKPVLIGEFGVNSLTWARPTDPHLRGLRQALWGGVLGGSVGTPLAWWWNEMDKENVYPVFGALAKILKVAEWSRGSWRPAEIEVESAGASDADAGPPPISFSGELNLNRQGRLTLPGLLHLTGPAAAARAFDRLPASVRSTKEGAAAKWMLEAEWGDKAALEIHVFGVRGEPTLVAYIDGREVARTQLIPPKLNLPYRQAMDRTVRVPVPPGAHAVSLAAEGGEWAAFDRCRVENVRCQKGDAQGWQPEALVLRQDRRALVYVVSPHAVYPAGAAAERLPAQHGVSLRLTDWPAGPVEIVWFDPESAEIVGRRSAVASGGEVRLEAPAFRVDLVAVLSGVDAK